LRLYISVDVHKNENLYNVATHEEEIYESVME